MIENREQWSVRGRWDSRGSWPAARGAMALVLGLAFAATGIATTVPRMDLREIVRKSDAIVEGRVEAVYSQWDAERKLAYTYISIRVDEAVKGHANRSVLIRQVGGRIGALDMRVSGMPQFSQGEQVMLFLRRQANNTFEVVGLGQGRYQIVGDVAIAHVSGVDLFDPKSGQVTRPAFVDSMPLAAFKAKIREFMK